MKSLPLGCFHVTVRRPTSHEQEVLSTEVHTNRELYTNWRCSLWMQGGHFLHSKRDGVYSCTRSVEIPIYFVIITMNYYKNIKGGRDKCPNKCQRPLTATVTVLL